MNPDDALELSKRFGDVGVPVGTCFNSRKQLKEKGLHKYHEAGISDTPEGATCVVINGEYPDQDCGETVTYIGSGNGKEDQQWDSGLNSALLKNVENGRPVRVVRGSEGNYRWSPWKEAYRYDGLYKVLDARIVRGPQLGPNGERLRQCQFWLERLPNQPPLPESSNRQWAEERISKITGKGKKRA